MKNLDTLLDEFKIKNNDRLFIEDCANECFCTVAAIDNQICLLDKKNGQVISEGILYVLAKIAELQNGPIKTGMNSLRNKCDSKYLKSALVRKHKDAQRMRLIIKSMISSVVQEVAYNM